MDNKLSPNQTPHWMVVYTTNILPDAHIVAGRLQSEGIPAVVEAAPGAAAIGITVGILGEVRVLVYPEDYDIALAILDTDVTELPEDTDTIIFDSDDANE